RMVLSDAHPDRIVGQPRGLGYGRDAAPAEGQGFTSRPTPAHLLVHERRQRLIFALHSGNRLGSDHRVILDRVDEIHQVILDQLLRTNPSAIPIRPLTASRPPPATSTRARTAARPT